ncbi:hypothetical protein F7725_002299 [Dissostichus mawsoni]|uniref:Uncharacterized protein n=1 Tax=Dissostichus mawsoni TaxID=36200 RepID=A0A7J5Y294_DISMA|nr:hypothetical protein F7725_002299 [Dissostichus mawsoni]
MGPELEYGLESWPCIFQKPSGGSADLPRPALSGFIFLLRNIHTVENWNCHTISALYQLQSRIQSSFLPVNLPTFHHNRTFCAHLGQKPTPEDELEERYLLDSITWPGPPPRSSPPALRQTSDPVHSLFAVLPTQGGREWHVGDQLEALVQMHDFQGRPKRYGGDFILARLHSPELGAGVAGKVLDHKNGFYSAMFPLLWWVLHRLRSHWCTRVKLLLCCDG